MDGIPSYGTDYRCLSQYTVSLLNLLLRTSLGSDDRISFRQLPLPRTDPVVWKRVVFVDGIPSYGTDYCCLSQYTVSLLNLLLRTSLGSDDRISFRQLPLPRTDPVVRKRVVFVDGIPSYGTDYRCLSQYTVSLLNLPHSYPTPERIPVEGYYVTDRRESDRARS